MSDVTPFVRANSNNKSAVAIFMSGSGTNAIKILEAKQASEDSSFDVVVIVTDRPASSAAQEIADKHEIPLIGNDIRSFYKSRGYSRITVATAEGNRLREAWTDEIRAELASYRIDFALFAGFMPLTNIAGDFPCLNVHPGDLTYIKNNERVLVGLHTIPIEKALLERLTYLRSTVIIALPYEETIANMDNGPVLGISEKINVDFMGYRMDELRWAFDNRDRSKGRHDFNDSMATVAAANLERLKVNGDWVVFPQVVHDFADGRFGADGENNCYYLDSGKWRAITAVEYGSDGKTIIGRD